MTNLLAILLLTIVPQDCVARDGVAALESNRHFDGDGRLVFRQFCGIEADDHYRFWKMQPDAGIRIWRDHDRGGWVAMWQDGDVIRVVRAPSYFESFTGHDPEQFDRQFLPAEARRKLKGR